MYEIEDGPRHQTIWFGIGFSADGKDVDTSSGGCQTDWFAGM
jgi:hypothetical protein